jgi:hypothetical protein
VDKLRLKSYSSRELESAWSTGAEHTTGSCNGLSKTRGTLKTRLARIVTITNQHVAKSGIVDIRHTQHVGNVEKIEYFSNRLDGPSFPQLKDFRHSQVE